jgi:hypothetical protein
MSKSFEVFTLGVKGNGELISRGLRQKNKKEVQGFCAILLFLELVLISDNVRFGAAFLKCGISAFRYEQPLVKLASTRRLDRLQFRSLAGLVHRNENFSFFRKSKTSF